MRSMAIDRRTLLGAFASAPLLSLTSIVAHASGGPGSLYISARKKGGTHFVTGMASDGRIVFDLPLPARGHSSAIHPARPEVVHFARRPGTFARVIDTAAGQVAAEIEARPDRHFYGHGAFSPDGALLYATENDFERTAGVIGIYAVDEGYRRIGEMPSHGIGPHDLRILPDGETMVVANGGIATRPDLPRMKLNIPTMQPSLVYLDLRDGALLEEVRLPPALHHLSIRHLDVSPDGTVALAMQDEGPKGEVRPLVGTHRRGADIMLFQEDAEAIGAMRQYCGSIAFDGSHRVLAASSPRGGVITLWDAASGRHLHSLAIADGCGVAPAIDAKTFIATSGAGGVFELSLSGPPLLLDGESGAAPSHWDNHVVKAL